MEQSRTTHKPGSTNKIILGLKFKFPSEFSLPTPTDNNSYMHLLLNRQTQGVLYLIDFLKLILDTVKLEKTESLKLFISNNYSSPFKLFFILIVMKCLMFKITLHPQIIILLKY
jgi:hypothetical protein